MTAPHLPAATPPPALAAFLRGIERRGAVLAELQAGDIHAGDAALGAAMQAFRDEAERLPVADWARRFWTLLIAQPGLRQRTPVALALDAGDTLEALGSGPRAALLLRLAAGLDEADAAAVLGVAPATYRLALQRALPHTADGHPDPDAWRRLRDHIHRRIKTLPSARLARLGRAREAALHGFDVEPIAPESAGTGLRRAADAGRPRWWRPALWSVSVATVGALLATVMWEQLDHHAADRERRVRVEPLGPPEPPASRLGAEAALLGHRDFDLVADAAGQAQAESLAFHAWLAARAGDGTGADPFGAAAIPVEGDGAVRPTAPDAPSNETDAAL